MKHAIIFILIGFIFGIQLVFGQARERPTLDERRYEAWFVEYEPYRLLLETAIDEYRQLSKEDFPLAGPRDVFVLVRSRTGLPPGLFQIWYGNSSDGYTVLNPQQVKWVLGETLESTLVDKNQYYSRESEIPFEQRTNQPELEYIEQKSKLTHADVVIGLENIGYYFEKQSGVFYEWGNDLLSRPYGLMGQMKVGVSTPMFRVGIVTPSLFPFVNGYVNYPGENGGLNGAWGGFGSFSFDQFYGELGYASLQGIPQYDPTVEGKVDEQLNYIDISFLGAVNTGLSISQIVAAVNVKMGGVGYRVVQRDITQDNLGGKKLGGKEYYYRGGIFVRADMVTPLLGAGYPQVEAGAQLIAGSGITLMGNATYNINQSLGIPVKVIYFGTEDTWDPSFAAFVGLSFNLNTE